MVKKTDSNSLGFIFGYKDTSSEKTSDGKTVFNVKFKSGISDKFPNKFKNFKDFWSQEILMGQTSQIYIQPEEFLSYFKHEFEDFFKNHIEFNKETFESRRYFFNYPINIEQYAALSSFSMAHLHLNLYQKWESDSVLSDTLSKSISEVFKNDPRPILEIYNDYKEVSAFIYDKEVSDSLGTHYTSKPKI